MSKVDTQDAAAEFMGRASNAQKIQGILHRYPWLSSALVLLIASITFSFFNENFLTPGNLSLILQQVAIVGAVAAGQTLIILTAGIDLSCGAIAIFASMVMAKTTMGDPYVEGDGLPVVIAFTFGLLVGTFAGWFNGFLVTKFKLPPFIVTLGTLNVFIAMTLIYALHYQGLGTCCLNWSVEPQQDHRFKQAAQLPAHERIIMLLAVGNLLNRVCVAHSPRRPLSDLLQELGS